MSLLCDTERLAHRNPRHMSPMPVCVFVASANRVVTMGRTALELAVANIDSRVNDVGVRGAVGVEIGGAVEVGIGSLPRSLGTVRDAVQVPGRSGGVEEYTWAWTEAVDSGGDDAIGFYEINLKDHIMKIG